MYQHCTACGADKPASDFTGENYVCNDCVREIVDIRAKQDRDRENEPWQRSLARMENNPN